MSGIQTNNGNGTSNQKSTPAAPSASSLESRKRTSGGMRNRNRSDKVCTVRQSTLLYLLMILSVVYMIGVYQGIAHHQEDVATAAKEERFLSLWASFLDPTLSLEYYSSNYHPHHSEFLQMLGQTGTSDDEESYEIVPGNDDDGTGGGNGDVTALDAEGQADETQTDSGSNEKMMMMTSRNGQDSDMNVGDADVGNAHPIMKYEGLRQPRMRGRLFGNRRFGNILQQQEQPPPIMPLFAGGEESDSPYGNGRITASERLNRPDPLPVEYEAPDTLKLPKPIFNVGFPKAGTSTIFSFFHCNGLKSQHWLCCEEQNHAGYTEHNKLMSRCLLENIVNGTKNANIFDGCGDYDMYAEMNGPRFFTFTRKRNLLDDGSLQDSVMDGGMSGLAAAARRAASAANQHGVTAGERRQQQQQDQRRRLQAENAYTAQQRQGQYQRRMGLGMGRRNNEVMGGGMGMDKARDEGMEVPRGRIGLASVPFVSHSYYPRIFLPQHHYLDYIHAAFPNATFILNLRPVDAWVKSVMGWGTTLQYELPNEFLRQIQELGMDDSTTTTEKEEGDKEEGGDYARRRVISKGKIYTAKDGYPELPSFTTNDMATNLTNVLTSIYNHHIAYVRKWVEYHPTHALVEVDITKNETGTILANAFGLQTSCWGHFNKNKGGADKGKGKGGMLLRRGRDGMDDWRMMKRNKMDEMRRVRMGRDGEHEASSVGSLLGDVFGSIFSGESNFRHRHPNVHDGGPFPPLAPAPYGYDGGVDEYGRVYGKMRRGEDIGGGRFDRHGMDHVPMHLREKMARKYEDKYGLDGFGGSDVQDGLYGPGHDFMERYRQKLYRRPDRRMNRQH